jgi:hypothetical protein
LPVRILLLILACAVVLAGCGGSSGPRIDRAVATKLARQADAIAASHDRCTARTHARILQRQTIAAINAGRIPAAYQETLQARVNEIAAGLALGCLTAPAPGATTTVAVATTPAPVVVVPAPQVRGPGPGRAHGHGRGEPKGHHKPKKDKGDKGGR